ncbi:ORF6C domain-containing protein [Lysinibacillus xylanilyticus]|uniref:ORF6C domain-containing protein n=1 Tax=Lysinibacillus xylanilyticus TaxID=582475 RepID=UPI003D049719
MAKSLNSEKAWQAYNLLVTQYYQITKGLQQVQPISLPYDEKRFFALEQRVQEIEQRLQGVTLHSGEQKRLRQAVTERVDQLCRAQARRPACFASIYREIKRRYQVESYRDVPQCKVQDALRFVSTWKGGADA